MKRVKEKRNQDFAAIGALLILTFLFFLGVLFPEPGEILFGFDTAKLFHPLLDYAFSRMQTGEIPLWNPYLFLGFPHYAEPQLSTFYPLLWLVRDLPFNLVLPWMYMVHFASTAVGTYTLTRLLGVSWRGALVAAVVLTFNMFMTSRLIGGHFPHLMVISYMPWVLAGMQWAVRAASVWGKISRTMLAALPLALAFLAGYAPFFPFLVIALTVFSFALAGQSWRERGPRAGIIVVLQWAGLGAFAGLLAAVQLLPTAEMTLLSNRAAGAGYALADMFYMPFGSLLTLFAPDLFGTPVGPVMTWDSLSPLSYWEYSVYIGIFPLLLFGLVWWQGKPKWRLWAGLALLTLVLAFGSTGGLHRLVYQIIPGFGLFRVPARFSYFFILIAALLSGFMFDRWLAFPAAHIRRWQPLLQRILVVGLLFVTFLAFVSVLWRATILAELEWRRIGGITDQMVRLALLFGGAMALIIWGHALKRWQVTVLAVVLLLIDFWGVGNKIVTLREIETSAGWETADAFIMEDRDRFRIQSHGLEINQAVDYGFQHLRGYDDFRTEVGVQLEKLADSDVRMVQLLGVRYLLLGPNVDFGPNFPGWELFTERDGLRIFVRNDVVEKAFVVHQVVGVADEAAALAWLAEPGTDWGETAVVQTLPNTSCTVEPGDPAAAQVTLHSYEAERIVLSTNTDASGWLVLNEIYYPGWRAFVSGEETIIQPTNYGLRGICLPAGTHEVVFSFEPVVFRIGLWVSGIAWGVLALVGVIALFVRRRGSIS